MKRIIRKHKRKILYTAPVVFLFVFSYLSLVPSSSAIGGTVGDVFTVDISINANIPINVVEASLLYPSDLVFASSTNKEDSVLDLWSQQPTIENDKGKITWSGGMLRMGGFTNSGKIMSVDFVAKATGTAEILINNASFALSDGQGTLVTPAMDSLTYTIESSPVTYTAVLKNNTNAAIVQETADSQNIGTMITKIFSPYDQEYDLNKDGRVDFYDFSILLFKI
jgi:hypothetical protein